MTFKVMLGVGMVAAMVSAGSSVEASEWKTMPLLDNDWSADFTLAYGAGVINGDDIDGDFAHGAQFSLNCPWFTPPKGAIRQQFNYNIISDGNTDVRSLEMNPRYYFSNDDLRFGVGPGLGYMWAENGANDRDAWSVQLGGDMEYRQGAMFYGAGVRYQWAQEMGASQTGLKDLDNLLAMARVGVNF